LGGDTFDAGHTGNRRDPQVACKIEGLVLVGPGAEMPV